MIRIKRVEFLNYEYDCIVRPAYTLPMSVHASQSVALGGRDKPGNDQDVLIQEGDIEYHCIECAQYLC